MKGFDHHNKFATLVFINLMIQKFCDIHNVKLYQVSIHFGHENITHYLLVSRHIHKIDKSDN